MRERLGGGAGAALTFVPPSDVDTILASLHDDKKRTRAKGAAATTAATSSQMPRRQPQPQQPVRRSLLLPATDAARATTKRQVGNSCNGNGNAACATPPRVVDLMKAGLRGEALLLRVVACSGTGCHSVVQTRGLSERGTRAHPVWSTCGRRERAAWCTVALAERRCLRPAARGGRPREAQSALLHVVTDNSAPTLGTCRVYGGTHPQSLSHLLSVECFAAQPTASSPPPPSTPCSSSPITLHKQACEIDGRLLRPYMRFEFDGTSSAMHRIVFLALEGTGVWHEVPAAAAEARSAAPSTPRADDREGTPRTPPASPTATLSPPPEPRTPPEWVLGAAGRGGGGGGGGDASTPLPVEFITLNVDGHSRPDDTVQRPRIASLTDARLEAATPPSFGTAVELRPVPVPAPSSPALPGPPRSCRRQAPPPSPQCRRGAAAEASHGSVERAGRRRELPDAHRADWTGGSSAQSPCAPLLSSCGGGGGGGSSNEPASAAGSASAADGHSPRRCARPVAVPSLPTTNVTHKSVPRRRGE